MTGEVFSKRGGPRHKRLRVRLRARLGLGLEVSGKRRALGARGERRGPRRER